jgi:hypothetical protein
MRLLGMGHSRLVGDQQRQAKDKSRGLFTRLVLNETTVCPCDLLCDSQAKPRALVTSRHQGQEQPLPEVFGHPIAVVSDFHTDGMPSRRLDNR